MFSGCRRAQRTGKRGIGGSGPARYAKDPELRLGRDASAAFLKTSDPALLQAGAHTVVATAWRIRDRDVVWLMGEF